MDAGLKVLNESSEVLLDGEVVEWQATWQQQI
jgi:hypothetical protein